jgi:hypothetical protein
MISIELDEDWVWHVKATPALAHNAARLAILLQSFRHNKSTIKERTITVVSGMQINVGL